MRSRIWFVVAALVAVAGFVCAGYWIAAKIGGMTAQTKRTPIPGNAVVELDRPGVYEVFYERAGSTPIASLPNLDVKVLAEATSEPVRLVKPSYDSSYTSNSRSGRIAFVLPVDQPGRYRVTASAPGTQPAVLAIGLGMMGDIFHLVGIGMAIVAVGIGAALAIVIMTLRQRAKAKS